MFWPEMRDRNAGEFAAGRYRRLAEGLGDAYYGRPKAGWKSKVARRLGIDVSYLTRIVKGERVGVGLDMIEEAVRRVPIRRAYFAPGPVPNATVEDADWRDYLEIEAEADAARARAASVPRWPASMTAVTGRFMAGSDEDQPARAARARIARELAAAVLRDPVVSAAEAVRDAKRDRDAVERAFKLVALLDRDRASSAASAADAFDPKLDEVTTKRLRVKAARPSPTGPRLPWPGAPGRYVGYRKGRPNTPEALVVFRLPPDAPDGQPYVLAGIVDVPDTPYFRRAIERGDLELA